MGSAGFSAGREHPAWCWGSRGAWPEAAAVDLLAGAGGALAEEACCSALGLGQGAGSLQATMGGEL